MSFFNSIGPLLTYFHNAFVIVITKSNDFKQKLFKQEKRLCGNVILQYKMYIILATCSRFHPLKIYIFFNVFI